MKALLDLDIFVYRIGFTTEDVDIEIAKYRMNDLVEKVLADVKATSYQGYLTKSKDEKAFRKQVYPEYKANRKSPRPVHYEALRQFLVEEWGAIMVEVIEADDALAIAQSDDTIIVSIDKDLDMVPGWHYNFVKEIKYYVHEDEAIRNFYIQLLMGDAADNVKGLKGIGEKKADKILSGEEDEEGYFERTRAAYGNDEAMLANGEVLWMMRKPYPLGRWKYTTFGSQLLQENDFQPELPLKQAITGMESTGEENLTDGSQLNGLNLQASTD